MNKFLSLAFVLCLSGCYDGTASVGAGVVVESPAIDCASLLYQSPICMGGYDWAPAYWDHGYYRQSHYIIRPRVYVHASPVVVYHSTPSVVVVHNTRPTSVVRTRIITRRR